MSSMGSSGEGSGEARGPQRAAGDDAWDAAFTPSGGDGEDEGGGGKPKKVAWEVLVPEDRHVRSKRDILRVGERAIDGFRRGKVSGNGLAGLSSILRLQLDVVAQLDAEEREKRAREQTAGGLPPPPPTRVKVTTREVTVERADYDLPPPPPSADAYALPMRDGDFDVLTGEMAALAATDRPPAPAVALGPLGAWGR